MRHESNHVHIYTIYRYTVLHTLVSTKVGDAREIYLQPRQPKDNLRYMYMNMNIYMYMYMYMYVHTCIYRLDVYERRQAPDKFTWIAQNQMF